MSGQFEGTPLADRNAASATASPSGYMHPDYAAAHGEWGRPRPLRHSGGWLVERDIAAAPGRVDAMGCYPLFACRDWNGLAADLAELPPECVAAYLVADPFGPPDPTLLNDAFDVVRPWKQHLVTDLSRPAEQVLAPQHRRNVARSLRQVEVVACARPLDHLDEWCAMYEILCQRHRIEGLRAFSRESFRLQLGVPGLTMFRAAAGDELVGIHLWYQQGDVAYGHLGATNERGYEVMASYALYWQALVHFRDRAAWLNLGAAPGAEADADSGLHRFKRGWSTGSRTAHFCGSIRDPDAYARLAASAPEGSRFFPAYRAHEFAPMANLETLSKGI